jgi:hypothetical protein
MHNASAMEIMEAFNIPQGHAVAKTVFKDAGGHLQPRSLDHPVLRTRLVTLCPTHLRRVNADRLHPALHDVNLLGRDVRRPPHRGVISDERK